MDRLDKISISAIAVLLTGSVLLIFSHRGEQKRERTTQVRIAAVEDPAAAAQLNKPVKLVKNLIEADSLAQAEALIRELMHKYPYQGEPYMLMGDVFMRRQEPLKAMHEYKQAIDLNPDYLDKKTPLFQGKKLKVAVGEALGEIEKQLRASPENGPLKSEKKLIYYLYRRIAGSCG